MTDVTVSLRTHNRRVWLQEAVESILSQEGVDFELIITDAGDGLDGTPEYLLSINDSRVKIRKPEVTDCGVMTVPKGATGEYINFFCDDDVMLPGALALKVGYLKEHPYRDMVFTSCVDMEGNLLNMGYMSSTDLHVGANFGTQLVSCSMPIGTVMARTSLVRQASEDFKNQPIRTCADWVIWLLCLRRTNGAAYLATPTFKYRVHDKTDTEITGWGQGGFARTHLEVWNYWLDKGYKVKNPLAIKAFETMAGILDIKVPEKVYA